MHHYRVSENRTEDNRLALRDSQGRCHIARAMNDMPASGTDLQGSVPGLGFRVLTCRRTDRAFKVIFEKIDCDVAAPRPARR